VELLEKLVIIASLQAFGLWAISGAVESAAAMLGRGVLVAGLVIPWLTTLPETIVTVKLCAAGYPVAGLYNSIVSAVFDMFIVFPLIARTRRADFRVWPAVISPLPLVVVAVLAGETAGEGIVLTGTAIGASMLAICIAFQLAVVRGATAKIHFDPMVTIELLSGLSALTFASIEFSNTVTALTALMPERLGGTIAAILTSLPDAIYALRAGVRDVDAAVAELAGCIVHDFLEAPAIALMLSKLVLYKQDIILLAAFTAAAAMLVKAEPRHRPVLGLAMFTVFLAPSFI